MLGVLYAMFLIESVLYTFLLTETLSTFVGISLLGGIVWRRANRWGALASLVTALARNFSRAFIWPGHWEDAPARQEKPAQGSCKNKWPIGGVLRVHGNCATGWPSNSLTGRCIIS